MMEGKMLRKVRRVALWRRVVVFSLVILLAGLPGMQAFASGGWFTGVTVDGRTVPLSVYQHDPPQEMTKEDAGPTLIDITVTLTTKEGDPDYPRGDDDGDTQGGAGSEEQDNYERVFQYMADAIYEMTEGQHRLRNVRIFTNGNQAKNADVFWDVLNKGHPRATVNGVTARNRCILMYDVFAEGMQTGPNTYADLVFIPADLEGAGYTLAHEMGHYFYGLYDEYVIKRGDIPVKKSIMNSQWKATGSKPDAYDWLNFSVAYQSTDPQGDWINTRRTEHHRYYGESGWETLLRDPSTDPGSGRMTGSLKRVLYPDLASLAPMEEDKPRRDLTIAADQTAARSALKVTWMAEGGDSTCMIILDRSGSMSGTAMENAKTAAKILVNLAEIGSATIGVISFDSALNTDYPLTRVTDEVVRQEMLDAIDAIEVGGLTAIGDAAAEGLRQLLALGVVNDVKSVFLLSDGMSNSGVEPTSVIPAYQEAQIPIFAFAYSGGADWHTMQELAIGTGGDVFDSPTTLEEIARYFQQAFERATGVEGVASGRDTAPAGVNTLIPVHVDPSIGRLMVTLVHEGGLDAADVIFLSPGGVSVEEAAISEGSVETMRTYLVEGPNLGEWQIQITPKDEKLRYSFHVTAAHAGVPIKLSTNVANAPGNAVVHPDPILLTATLSREMMITGATVLATVKPPAGKSYEVALLDDGEEPDDVAGDGVYSALVEYKYNGVYNVSVWAYDFDGKAMLTAEGLVSTPRTDGTLPPPLAPVPLGVAFERQSATQVIVSNSPDGDAREEEDTLILAPILEQAISDKRLGRLGCGAHGVGGDHTGDWLVLSLSILVLLLARRSKVRAASRTSNTNTG